MIAWRQFGVVLSVACVPICASIAGAPRAAAREVDLQPIRAAGQKIETLHVKKRQSQPRDWLASHPEAGQTFEQYRATNPNRPTAKRTTLYLQPLGEFSVQQQQAIDRAKELLGLFYGLPVKSLEPVSLDAIPAKARRNHPSADNPQILTSYVLSELLPPRRPTNAVAVLAFTPIDLWPGEGWNFVFGQGALRDRVGVYSLARYGDPAIGEEERRLYLRRALKVACHETGHMLGIAHCTAYECGMNGSNHAEELDRNQLAFCPECEQKVWWSCPVDPRKRYAALRKFAEECELSVEENLWKASLDRLGAD